MACHHRSIGFSCVTTTVATLLLGFFAMIVVVPVSFVHGFSLHRHRQHHRASSSLVIQQETGTTNDPSFCHSSSSLFPSLCTLSLSERNNENDDSDDNVGDDNVGGVDVSLDDRLYRIRLPRATGIEWGTDLSFAFVYVRELDPTGPAFASKLVQKGDQLVELTAVLVVDNDDDSTTAAASSSSSSKNKPKPINVLGASFDYVMNAFANLQQTVTEVDLVFFRGSKSELKALVASTSTGSTGNNTAPSSDDESETISITVIQNKGTPQEHTRVLTAPVGVNLRQVCIDNNINVYQSVTRWTNCKGKQLCGTCIVNVTDGSVNTNRKSMDEESTLRENPDSYRLSCITFCYGDVTIETFPPISAAQWTR